MKTILRLFWKALRYTWVVFSTFVGIAIFVSPAEAIICASRWFTDAGHPLPASFSLKNEAHLAVLSIKFVAVLMGIAFVYPFICEGLKAAWKRYRLVRNVETIARVIPDNLIPPDCNWETVENRINPRLRRKFLHRPAEMVISVNRVESTPNEDYRLIPRIAAVALTDHRTKLPVWLHAYFDGASEEQIRRIRDCGRSSSLNISGLISRVEVRKHGDWMINIDLCRCVVVS